jgi:hypothetical protein
MAMSDSGGRWAVGEEEGARAWRNNGGNVLRFLGSGIEFYAFHEV